MNGFILAFATALTSVNAPDVPSSPYDLYVSVRTSTSLRIGEDEIAELTVGEVLPVLDIQDGWLKTRRIVGDAEALGWVSARDVIPSCHPLSRRYVPPALQGEELAKWREEKRWYARLPEYLDVSEEGEFILSRADAVRVARLHSPEYCDRQQAFLQAILNRRPDPAGDTTAPTSASALARDGTSPSTPLRPWARYREDFCVRIVTGGKARRDDPVAGRSRSHSPPTGRTISEGSLGLLEAQVLIRNLQGNVVGIQDSLYQIEALFEAGREEDRQQVELTRQKLYSVEASLLVERNRYEAMLDRYKVTLGLPPDLPVRIEDPLLEPFNLIDARLMAAQTVVNELLTLVRDDKIHPTVPVRRYDDLKAVRKLCWSQFAMVEGDVRKFEQALPDRIASLQSLASRPQIAAGQIDLQIFSVGLVKERLANLRSALDWLKGMMTRTFSQIDSVEKIRQAAADNHKVMSHEARRMLRDLLTELYDELVVLSLIQARARLDTTGLTSINLEFQEALEIARANRQDWGEVRAQLAENLANETESGFSRSWQQSCVIGDDIQLRLRRILRNIREDQIKFEVRRAAVFVSLIRIDLTRIGLTKPSGAGGRPTTARDVQEALRMLLQVQNDFLATWVDYESLRVDLDLELGIIELDECGMWIDRGPVTADRVGELRGVKLIDGVD
jgi:hypothetical protein